MDFVPCLALLSSSDQNCLTHGQSQHCALTTARADGSTFLHPSEEVRKTETAAHCLERYSGWHLTAGLVLPYWGAHSCLGVTASQMLLLCYERWRGMQLGCGTFTTVCKRSEWGWQCQLFSPADCYCSCKDTQARWCLNCAVCSASQKPNNPDITKRCYCC